MSAHEERPLNVWSHAARLLCCSYQAMAADPRLARQIRAHLAKHKDPVTETGAVQCRSNPELAQRQIDNILRTLALIWDFVTPRPHAWAVMERSTIRTPGQEPVPLSDAVLVALEFFRPHKLRLDGYVH